MYISNTNLKVEQNFCFVRHYAIKVCDGMGLPTDNEAPVPIYSNTKLHQNFIFIYIRVEFCICFMYLAKKIRRHMIEYLYILCVYIYIYKTSPFHRFQFKTDKIILSCDIPVVLDIIRWDR
jgi:hypothetical protein